MSRGPGKTHSPPQVSPCSPEMVVEQAQRFERSDFTPYSCLQTPQMKAGAHT